jgi:hypothetical protein
MVAFLCQDEPNMNRYIPIDCTVLKELIDIAHSFLKIVDLSESSFFKHRDIENIIDTATDTLNERVKT